MKKCFYVETEEELQMGDVVSLTLFKELEDGKVTIEKDVEFNEATKDMLINFGYVEERGVEEEEEEEENNDLLDFGEPCEELEDLIEDFDALEERVDKLENMHKDYVSLTHKMLDTFKEFVLNLPDNEEKKNAQPKKK